MPYPAAITLRQCTVGGSSVFESGEELTLVAEIKSSRGLIWGETGWQFLSDTVVVTGAVGAELQFSLPVTDLAGWRLLDDPSKIIDVSVPGSNTHTYTITLYATRNGKQVGKPRIVGPFALPADDLSPVDLDLTLPVTTISGGMVRVPDVWSEQVAQAVAAAGSADAAASSAGDAANSAIAAGLARDGAVAARTGAETAQGLAEDARDAAQAAQAATVTTGAVVGDDLILTRTDTTTVNAGNVRGGQGVPGPPNALAIGTVTTGAPGSAAAASITGTAPEQVLNLTIPTGATGAVSAWEYYAAGRPDISGTLDAAALAWRNAAPSGSTFYSTDGPQGAWVWRKRGATWVCVEGDTGLVTLAEWSAGGVFTTGSPAVFLSNIEPGGSSAGGVYARRTNAGALILLRALRLTPGLTSGSIAIPSGWLSNHHSASNAYGPLISASASGSWGAVAGTLFLRSGSGAYIADNSQWSAAIAHQPMPNPAWPTALPAPI